MQASSVFGQYAEVEGVKERESSYQKYSDSIDQILPLLLLSSENGLVDSRVDVFYI